MDAHIKKMQSLLRLDLVDEVRMIGIWGPPGIGKSTISRFLFNQLSNNFQSKAIMVNIKQNYPKPCFDEGSAQLQLQNDMLSKMINHKDIIITHLGAAQNRLKDRKVLLVLDDVDRQAQLRALAEDSRWYGPGSRIIIVTQDPRVLLAHGIDLIYKVKYPSNDEAFRIFCMYAFPQKFPEDDDFIELACEITHLVGNLPQGLQIMGSYFLRRPKHEWIEALPKLKSRLDGSIESILKFSYDALSDEICKFSSFSSPCQSQNWEHDVFVSYRGKDVRIAFISHILKEFRRKGIKPFIDNSMEISTFNILEFKRAIKGSQIAIVLLSKNYASSSWCLENLVKIIKYRRKIGQKVITIFYQVKPIDVKKLIGEFGMAFEDFCIDKTSEVIRKWREALAEVATIAGYDSRNWADEASAIEEVTNDILTMLNKMVPLAS